MPLEELRSRLAEGEVRPARVRERKALDEQVADPYRLLTSRIEDRQRLLGSTVEQFDAAERTAEQQLEGRASASASADESERLPSDGLGAFEVGGRRGGAGDAQDGEGACLAELVAHRAEQGDALLDGSHVDLRSGLRERHPR